MNGGGRSDSADRNRIPAEFPHGNRVVRGNCHWDKTPEVIAALEELRRSDPFTYGQLAGQIKQSEGNGLGASRYYQEHLDYRCPLQFTPDDVPDPPWLGELKASDQQGKKAYRLYFGEAINYQDHVIGVSLHDSKVKRLTAQQNSARQKLHIRQAMRYLMRYFREQGYRWAPFPSGKSR